MKQVGPGDTIGTVECPGCGADTPLKINAHENVYFFCAKILGTNAVTGKPERCMTRINYGRQGSKKIIEQFLATKKDITDVQHEAGDAGAEDSDTGSTGDAGNDTAGGGLGAALKRFLTE